LPYLLILAATGAFAGLTSAQSTSLFAFLLLPTVDIETLDTPPLVGPEVVSCYNDGTKANRLDFVTAIDQWCT
ncbi:hypothetical protein AAF712_015900, partial [Marasmius tenuissimus]